MKPNAKIKVFIANIASDKIISIEAPEKITTDKSLIIIILAYSAIKISANLPLLYSTLNPDTNSDSPSAKSNGVRLVSAKVEINQVKNKGKTIRRGQVD